MREPSTASLYKRAIITEEEKTHSLHRLFAKQCVQLGVGRGQKIEGKVDALAAMVFVSTDEDTKMETLQLRFRKSRVRLGRPVDRLQSTVNAALLHHFLKETLRSRENERRTEFIELVVLCERVIAARFVLVVQVSVKEAKEEGSWICHT